MEAAQLAQREALAEPISRLPPERQGAREILPCRRRGSRFDLEIAAMVEDQRLLGPIPQTAVGLERPPVVGPRGLEVAVGSGELGAPEAGLGGPLRLPERQKRSLGLAQELPPRVGLGREGEEAFRGRACPVGAARRATRDDAQTV
jgi:hypothetical protein